MVGNNLSQLGVDAGQLDAGLNTLSTSLVWLPTTGEFGRGFGDFEQHQEVATRVGVHFTRSDEDRQSQPDTEAIENSQIRTSDGNVIFTPGLFGDGISITDAKYQMFAADAGPEVPGPGAGRRALLAHRLELRRPGVEGCRSRTARPRVQVEASAMPVPKLLQTYVSGSRISASTAIPGTRASASTTTRSGTTSSGGTPSTWLKPLASRPPGPARAGRRQRRGVLQQLHGELPGGGPPTAAGLAAGTGATER